MIALVAALVIAQAIEANPARESDAFARSEGNDLASAHAIGNRIFARIEPVQVLKVRVEQIGTHRVAGLTLSGVKFHHSVDVEGFLAEIVRLAEDAIAAAPIEEVDVEVTVPLSTKAGIVVSGDGAMPTARTVFTITVHRGEAAATLANRLRHGTGIFWDPTFLAQLKRA